MKHYKTIIRLATAALFSAPLIAAYLFSRDTVVSIINYKIIWPMHIVPGHYTPWLEVASGISHTFALILPSMFCGALFGYFFRARTALWAIPPVTGLAVYLFMSLRSHWFHWTVYYAHAFLAFSFIVFSALAAGLYQKLLIDGEKTRVKQRAILASILFVTVAGAGWLHFDYPLLGTRVSGKGFEGIILSKRFVEDMGRQGSSNWWDIQESDIITLEDRLENYVKSHPHVLGPHVRNELSSYRRWYHSELSGTGNKQIYVLLMHGSHVSRPEWLHVHFGVAGGGDYYCSITYSVNDGSFEDARCNADA